MTPYTAEGILALTKKLCAIPSVSGNAEQENAACDAIAAELRSIAPTGTNTLSVETVACEGDPLGRRAVLALLRRSPSATRTVLLTGHFDVVDTDVCGTLRETAFDLDAYTKAIGSRPIPEDARKDLESGNWIFGRGSMDMKCGQAMFIAAIGKLAQEPGELNIAYLAVPDEEANSAGMRGAMPAFVRMVRREKLDMVAALTGEPCFWTTGAKAARPYYTGTTGKIMPMFLAVGREAHIGCYYEGVSAALMAACIVQEVEAAPEMIDGTGADALTPPVCLAMEIRRRVYSVTVPERAVAYFNVLTASKTPAEVLDWCLAAARRAAARAMAQIDASAQAFAARGAVAACRPGCRILTARDLMQEAAKAAGKTSAEMASDLQDFAQSLAAGTDAREISVRCAERLADLAALKGPAIVVGFVPPYYPQRTNHRRTDNERRLRRIIEEEAAEGARLAGDGATLMTEVFGGITDLSFLGFEGERSALQALADNMPGWGVAYSLPMDELLAVDIPVANMGPAGRDAHKDTERLELRYSLQIAPRLLLSTLAKLEKQSE